MNTVYGASKLAPFALLDEPLLSFQPEDQSLDENPLRGIDIHGPYSSGIFSTFNPQLRLATIAPAAGWPGLRSLIDTLRSSQPPGDRKEYVPAFRGFEAVFGVPVVAASNAHIKFDDRLPRGEPPHLELIHLLRGAIDRLTSIRDQFDVVLVHLPDAWQNAFRAPGFDAHDSAVNGPSPA